MISVAMDLSPLFVSPRLIVVILVIVSRAVPVVTNVLKMVALTPTKIVTIVAVESIREKTNALIAKTLDLVLVMSACKRKFIPLHNINDHDHQTLEKSNDYEKIKSLGIACVLQA